MVIPKNIIVKFVLIFILLNLCISCSSNDEDSFQDPPVITPKEHSLTIFHINDQHGRIENFAKIKHIVDQERLTKNVLLVCAGDMFSGNPVVDNHSDKGYPMIDIMNKTGFDVAVLGNHEFDYGESTLKKRMEQATFDWVCANVDMGSTGIPEPKNYTTVNFKDFKVTLLGLVETNGKKDAVIPLTHPWKVENLIFQPYSDVINNYSDIKSSENADLYIALTHLGESVDFLLANNYGFFDMIIGGHSHTTTSANVNSTPIIHAGSNLNYLGKATLTVKEGAITSFAHEHIDLSSYQNKDATIEELAASYDENSGLDEVIGYASAFHQRSDLGCFYTHALRTQMEADISFQNTGGIRNSLDEGDITKRDVFTFDPFNNGSVIYTMKISEIAKLLKETRSAVYYAGIQIIQDGPDIEFRDLSNKVLPENTTLTVAINDYIPAVNESYFPSNAQRLSLTTAETIIAYLETNKNPIDFTNQGCYFRYSQ